MKIYILGIFAILVSSIGFSAFQSADAGRESARSPIEELRKPSPLTSPGPAIASIGSTAVLDEADFAATAEPTARRPEAIRSGTATRTRYAAPRPKAARAAPFADTVIYYSVLNRPEPPEISEIRTSVAKTESRRKGKSFFSKSFAVIKQPYKWLKAVASKLN